MNSQKIITSLKKLLFRTQEKLKKMHSLFVAMKNEEATLEKIKVSHPEKKERVIVDVSVISITKATLAIIGLLIVSYVLFEIRGILLLLFISLFLAAAVDPMVNKLEKFRIPRSLSIIFIFLIIGMIIIFFFVQIIPLVVEQIREIAISISTYLKSLYFDFVNEQASIPLIPGSWNGWLREFLHNIQLNQVIDYLISNLTNIRQYLQQLATGSLEALKTAGSAVGGTVSVVVSFLFKLIIVVFFVFFMVVGRKDLKHFFTSLFPSKFTPYIMEKIGAVQSKIGAWLNGTLILAFCMFILSLTGLLIFGVNYALTLALLTGLADIIPYVGPFIAYLTIAPVALNQGVWIFVSITIWFIAIEQIEANILVPLVMKKAVGLNPIVVMMAMLIGFQFMGILGVIISIPAATSIAIFVNDYTEKNKNNS